MLTVQEFGKEIKFSPESAKKLREFCDLVYSDRSWPLSTQIATIVLLEDNSKTFS